MDERGQHVVWTTVEGPTATYLIAGDEILTFPAGSHVKESSEPGVFKLTLDEPKQRTDWFVVGVWICLGIYCAAVIYFGAHGVAWIIRQVTG